MNNDDVTGAAGTQPGPSEADHAWRLWQLSDLTTPWALRVVVTLGVADLLVDGPVDAALLAKRTGADSGALARLLRHLAARGVFFEVAPGLFELNDAARCLRAGHPSRMHEWLSMDGAAGRMDQAYAQLLSSVRTGGAAYAEMHGRSFYDDLEADPELHRSFDELMSQDSVDYGSMVDHLDWSGVRHVVDVGGGQGELLVYLLARHPHLRGSLFELAGTAEQAPALLATNGVSDRCEVVTGSFFDEVRPSGADTYLLASVLHNWNDSDATEILRRTAQAAGPGGRIVVFEGCVDDTTDQSWATHLDLKMLVLLGGRERTAEEFQDLARDAGLSVAGVTRTSRGPFALPFAVMELVVDDHS
ncbi:methyltransferase [Phytoactinopolyspora mesophila]|uniref:Methyltransferase n=1 Tax=Phytoactinopolyspora mesophila TaxID=2650750 RepID=A0A7K3LXU7_9ACTN|nr:methyltransferase [Phytoactinopolyspora mesophila]NDL55835.1 methyltransferase [Phytoactinopolyspora mesophila]